MKTRKTLRTITLIIALMAIPFMLQAQYSGKVPTIPGLNTKSISGSPTILGIDLSKIDFQNSYSMQVSSFGDDAVALGLLKSSFNYAINPQVSFQGSVGLMHSPFSTFTPLNEQASFMNDFDADNTFYSGEITYRPKENMVFQIGFSRLPGNTYNQFYSPYSFRRLGY